MSRSNWLFYVAIGGCLATSIAYGQPVSNNTGNQERPPQVQDEPPKQEQLPPSFPENVRRIAEAVEAISGRKDSAEDSERAARDLQAQEKMAFWTMAMFFLALFQLVLGGITLGFLYCTFRETRRTAIAGIFAAKAAMRSNIQDRQNFQKLERPYIFITNVAVSEIGKGGPRIEFVIGNYGKLPAIIDHTLTALVASPFVERPTPGVQEPPNNLIFAPAFSAAETRALSLNALSTMFVTTSNKHTPFLSEEDREMLLVMEVHYRGPFGGNYITDIYMRWDWNSDGFVKVDDERYNKSA